MNKIAPFKFGTQNVTEGYLPGAILDCDAAVLQEVDAKKVISQCRDVKMEYFIPSRDRHQALIWDPGWVDITSYGWTRFHRSGTAENWPFKSPARGMIWARGRLLEHDTPVALFGVWFLNSWNPMAPDKHTLIRRNIVAKTTLPKVREKIETWRPKRLVIGGGDANSIRWHGAIPGLNQPWENGLDRIWYDKRLEQLYKREGPVTGIGSDLKHHSRIVKLRSKA